MAELKPCPFCGGTKIVVDTIANIEMIDEPNDYEISHYIAVCCFNSRGCGSSTGAWESKELAIRAWNRRAQDECTDCV